MTITASSSPLSPLSPLSPSSPFVVNAFLLVPSTISSPSPGLTSATSTCNTSNNLCRTPGNLNLHYHYRSKTNFVVLNSVEDDTDGDGDGDHFTTNSANNIITNRRKFMMRGLIGTAAAITASTTLATTSNAVTIEAEASEAKEAENEKPVKAKEPKPPKVVQNNVDDNIVVTVEKQNQEPQPQQLTLQPTAESMPKITTTKDGDSDNNDIKVNDNTNVNNNNKNQFDPRYFIAGGACASISHGIATPFDVVKTRIQSDPDTFDGGFKQTASTLVKNEGIGTLLTGLTPTIIGFGLEGGVKFGVYEGLKPVCTSLLSSLVNVSSDDKFLPYLLASIGAGAVASILLCPMERARIKLVTEKEKETDGDSSNDEASSSIGLVSQLIEIVSISRRFR